MEMDKVEQLNELIASRKIINSSIGPLWYIFPFLHDKLFTKFLYDKKYKECSKLGILSVSETIEFHKKNGAWSDEKEQRLNKLLDFMSETENNIKIEKNRIRKQKFETWLRKLQREYFELANARSAMLCSSAEFISNEYAYFYLLWKCIRKIDTDDTLWKSFSDIESDVNIELIQELLNLMADASKEIETSSIRSMARSPFWRIRWKSSNGDSTLLFGRTAQNLTNDQLMLVYWSQIYDSVYDSIDRPPDSIIEDDAKLDEWLTEQAEARSQSINQKFFTKESNISKSNSKIENANEIYKIVDGYFNKNGVFVKYSDDDRWKEIERIRALNSKTARIIKQKEETILSKTPGVFIQEHELRRRKEDREAMGGIVKQKRKEK